MIATQRPPNYGLIHTADAVGRVLLVPKSHVRVIDTWSVVGMRGTGSHDFVVDDGFVPQARTFALLDPVAEPNILYHPRLIMVNSGPATAGTALGLARGAIDAFCRLAADTASTMSTTPLRDRALVQARLALTHGMHEAVRATTLVFHAAGTNAVYEKHPLERYFRDVHVAVQHAVGRPENIEEAGKALLGLRPENMGW